MTEIDDEFLAQIAGALKLGLDWMSPPLTVGGAGRYELARRHMQDMLDKVDALRKAGGR